MIWLQAGESRDYLTNIRVLDGAEQIAAASAAIAAIAAQPETDFPEPSGNFRPLTGRQTPG